MNRWWLVLIVVSIFLATADSVETAFQHTPLWSYSVGDRIDSVKYSNGRVFAASGDILYALNKEGYLEWKYPLDSPITSVYAMDNRVVVSSTDNLLSVINFNGITAWSRELEGQVGYDRAVNSRRGLISVGTTGGIVHILDDEGNQVGRFNAGGYVISTRVLEEDVLVVSDRQIFLLRDNGTLVKTFELNKFIRSVRTTDEYVVVGLNDGRIQLYDTSGNLLWVHDTGDQVGTLHLSNKYVSAGTKNKRLYLFSVNGTLMWERLMTDSVAATYVSEPFVAVSTLDNKVYLYYTDSRLKWVYQTEGRALNLVVGGGYMISGTNTGRIYASELPRKSEGEVLLVASIMAISLMLAAYLSVKSLSKM